jgi:hypothetical protein
MRRPTTLSKLHTETRLKPRRPDQPLRCGAGHCGDLDAGEHVRGYPRGGAALYAGASLTERFTGNFT